MQEYGPLRLLAGHHKRRTKSGCRLFCSLRQFFSFSLVVFCFLVLGCQYHCNRLPGKARLGNDLLRVEWDVKPYTLTQRIGALMLRYPIPWNSLTLSLALTRYICQLLIHAECGPQQTAIYTEYMLTGTRWIFRRRWRQSVKTSFIFV